MGVQASQDRQRFLVANAGGSVTVHDLAGGQPAESFAVAAPTRLERLAGIDRFLLNETGAGPLFVLEGGGTERGVYFVPAD